MQYYRVFNRQSLTIDQSQISFARSSPSTMAPQHLQAPRVAIIVVLALVAGLVSPSVGALGSSYVRRELRSGAVTNNDINVNKHNESVYENAEAVNNIYGYSASANEVNAKKSKRSSSLDGAGFLVDLEGGIATLGEYWAYVEIGDVSLRLQVDTGSSSLVLASASGYSGGAPIACSSDHCGLNTANTWICRRGSENDTRCCAGLEPETCGFYLEYGGDSDYHVTSEGVLETDLLSLNNKSFGEVVVYKALKETGPWPTRVDGILGLGLPRLNCNPTCSPPAYEAVLNDEDTSIWGFGMCLGDVGGKLVLGSIGKEEKLYHGTLSSVPMLSTGLFGTYYSVGLAGISVGGEPIKSTSYSPPRQAIVDSGTTLLLLEKDIWDTLVQFFQARFCSLPGVCTEETIFDRGVCLTQPPQGFPTLSFDFEGVRLDLPPSMYFIQYKADVFCLGIQPANDRTVLGDTFMRAFYTFFDLARRRVAFARPNRQLCGHVNGSHTSELGSKPGIHLEPEIITSTSRSTEAMQFSVGAITGIGAIIGQLFICIEATRYLRPRPGVSSSTSRSR